MGASFWSHQQDQELAPMGRSYRSQPLKPPLAR